MLHILLLILKIIGILLAVILGLVLLILLTVLFVPVRYYADGAKQGKELSGKVKISWLFHGITFTAGYDKGVMYQDVRIFGISLNKASAFFEKRRAKKAKRNGRRRAEQDISPADVRVEGKVESVPKIEGWEPTPQDEDRQINIDLKVLPDAEKASADAPAYEQVQIPLLEEEAASGMSLFFDRIKRFFRAVWDVIKKITGGLVGIVKKILAIPGKVLAFFRKIKLTISSICDKITYWREFLGDERTKAALALTKKSTGRVFKHIAPRKLQGEVTFGFGDPCTTGQVLAGVCALYPVYQDHLRVCPDFEQEILEGSLRLRGRIYAFVLLHIAWTIYRDKNIKFVIKTFQHKEEQ